MSRSVDERADAALEQLAALWTREREATRARFAEERAGRSFAERVERGRALGGLVVVDVDAAPGDRMRLRVELPPHTDLADLALRPGSPVLLWWGDAPEDGDSAVRAVVGRTGAGLTLVVDGDVPERLLEGAFRLDLEAPEVTFDRGDAALWRWRGLEAKDEKRPLRDVLLAGAGASDEGVVVEAAEIGAWHDEALNEPQREAVRHALASRPLFCIQGPPGTGKTRTLVELIRQAIDRDEQVLATAASNTAVDNLAERLAAAGVPVVRLGHPARVSEAMEAHTLDAQLEQTDAWKLARQWTREARAVRRKAQRRAGLGRSERRALFAEARGLERDARGQLRGAQKVILGRAAVVCATAASAASPILAEERFDRVVLDEATQLTDPLALVALGRAPRATLAGDDKQLPPTVIDPQAEREGLGATFFERIVQRAPELARELVVQHRMHAAIMAFPSERMYGGRLVAAEGVAAHRLEDLGVRADAQRDAPWLFVDAAGRGWEEEHGEDDPSARNPGQAERVAAEVRRLVRRGVAPEDVAVITPYAAEARLLRRALADLREQGLEVGTVDGFQGREKEAIVVDLVRSNADGRLGFLEDVRRMNVALTRARRFLLVVGDSATLGAHAFYGAFLEAAEKGGAYLSAWSDEPDEAPFE